LAEFGGNGLETRNYPWLRSIVGNSSLFRVYLGAVLVQEGRGVGIAQAFDPIMRDGDDFVLLGFA
jgi:hypothetical protein